jgi:microcystin-dependent protein
MSTIIPVNFTVGAFPVGFKGNCQDFANALAERLKGTINLGTSGGPIFQAQYGGVQPSTDQGPWWKGGTDLYVFDPATGQYQPMEDQFPVGGCFLWGGPGAPARSLLCQGQQVSRIQYSRLFQRVGGTWGVGDGANTFNLPPGGCYLVSAGTNAITGLAYPNGVSGGGNTITISANNLPPLQVMAHGIPYGVKSQQQTGYFFIGAASDMDATRWDVWSTEDQPVLGVNHPITIPPPPYAALNLVIRYI